MMRCVTLLTFLVSPALLASAEPPKPDRLGQVRRGMTVEEVKQVLGMPARVSREVLFRRYVEEWHYDEPAGWVEFQCLRGEAPFVQNVHVDLNTR
jgi:hypothetical protein